MVTSCGCQRVTPTRYVPWLVVIALIKIYQVTLVGVPEGDQRPWCGREPWHWRGDRVNPVCCCWRPSEGSSGLDGSAFRDLPEESDADTDVDTDTTGPDESTVGEDAVGEHKEADVDDMDQKVAEIGRVDEDQ